MAELFDSAHFKVMTGDDRALQAEIVALFRDQAAKWALVLVPETPTQECRDVAHTLKGSARGLGLWQLAAACERAEAAVGGADAADVLRALRESMAKALHALDALVLPAH